MELTVQVCFSPSTHYVTFKWCYYTDIDECVEGTDLCDSNADCTNTIGSHNRTCIVGYSGNGYTCGYNIKITYDKMFYVKSRDSFVVRIAGMETYFFMMAIHYPMTTPMELYLCVSTMCMGSPSNCSLFLDNMLCAVEEKATSLSETI